MTNGDLPPLESKRNWRHWILGLGSGDIHLSSGGNNAREFVLPNVMFVGKKLSAIEHLVAMKPNEQQRVLPTVVGEPS